MTKKLFLQWINRRRRNFSELFLNTRRKLGVHFEVPKTIALMMKWHQF